MSSGRQQSAIALPRLMEAIPRWYPGAWGPPAETLSWASVMVAAIATVTLFRREEIRALFKFERPVYPIALAMTACIISAIVVTTGSKRPGGNWPRVWSLVVLLCCVVMLVWSIAGTASPRWDLPAMHSLSAIVFMAALPLSARVLRVHPFSRLVQHVAPAALAVVTFICLPLAYWAQVRVINKEQDRLTNKIAGLERLAEELRKSGAVLDDQQLSTFLPQPSDWKALGVLHKQTEMNAVMVGLYEAVWTRLADPTAGRFDLTRVFIERWEDQQFEPSAVWRGNIRFESSALGKAENFRRLGEIYRELEIAASSSPDENAEDQQRRQIQHRLDEFSKSSSQQWIAGAFRRTAPPSVKELLEMPLAVGGNWIPLGDVQRWETVSPWLHGTTAGSTTRAWANGCVSISRRFSPYSVPATDPESETRYTNRYIAGFECSIYIGATTEASEATILQAATLQVTAFRQSVESPDGVSEFEPTDASWTNDNGRWERRHVRIFFNVQAKAVRPHFQGEVLQAMREYAAGHYGVSTSPEGDNGFCFVANQCVAVRSQTLMRGDIETVEVNVETCGAEQCKR